jgi:hypothetical protein
MKQGRPYQNVTLHLDPQVWKELKNRAAQQRTYIRDIVNSIICERLQRDGITIKEPPIKIKAPPKPPKGSWRLTRYPGNLTEAQLKARERRQVHNLGTGIPKAG